MQFTLHVEVAMTPVRIRGKTYRSVAAAARALNVGRGKIERNLDSGTPDAVAPCKTQMKRPCIIDGAYYPSLTSAAKDMGVSVEAVRQRVKRNAEWLGKTAPVSRHVLAWRGIQ